MKIIPRLSELPTQFEVFSVYNIDDVFTELAVKGIKEVEVTREQMLMITMWMIANVQKTDEININAWKAMSEGKVDTFLGIKLRLQ